MSPLGTLARGYAIAYGPNGRIVRDAEDVVPGDAVRITLARGAVETEVRRVIPGEADPGTPESEPG